MAAAFLKGGFFAHFLKFGITKKLNSFQNASHLFPHNLRSTSLLFSYCYAQKRCFFVRYCDLLIHLTPQQQQWAAHSIIICRKGKRKGKGCSLHADNSSSFSLLLRPWPGNVWYVGISGQERKQTKTERSPNDRSCLGTVHGTIGFGGWEKCYRSHHGKLWKNL